jgi:hypothetical protein
MEQLTAPPANRALRRDVGRTRARPGYLPARILANHGCLPIQAHPRFFDPGRGSLFLCWDRQLPIDFGREYTPAQEKLSIKFMARKAIYQMSLAI